MLSMILVVTAVILQWCMNSTGEYTIIEKINLSMMFAIGSQVWQSPWVATPIQVQGDGK